MINTTKKDEAQEMLEALKSKLNEEVIVSESNADNMILICGLASTLLDLRNQPFMDRELNALLTLARSL